MQNNNEQINASPARKPSCGSCCCGAILVFVVICVIGYFTAVKIAENSIFLETENVTLMKTYDLNKWKQDQFLQGDPRTNCFQESDNRTNVTSLASNHKSNSSLWLGLWYL